MRRDVKRSIAVAYLSWSRRALSLSPGSTRGAWQRNAHYRRLQSFPDLNFHLAHKEDDDSPVTVQEGRTPASMISASDHSRDHRHPPAALRNREFISKELYTWLEKDAGGNNVLEIASGTGCHAEAFAKALPAWTFQPTEYDEPCIPAILATIDGGGYGNIRPPLVLDVCSDPSTWPRPASGGSKLWDVIVCINMIHISPKECTTGLLAGAAAGLKTGGHLFLYGPFALGGLLEPDSNKAFHESLGARSGGLWGIRDIAWVADLADGLGLELTAITPMPANNFFVVLTKVREPGDSSSVDERTARVADVVSTIITPTKEAFVKTLASR